MQQEPSFAAMKAVKRLPLTSLQWQLDQTPGRGITNTQGTNVEALNKRHHLLQSEELLVRDSAPDVSKEEKDIPALPWMAIPCSISLPAPTHYEIQVVLAQAKDQRQPFLPLEQNELEVVGVTDDQTRWEQPV